MTVRKKPNGKWFARKWVRMPDGTRERVFVMPKDYALPNTRVAAEEALRRRVTEVVEGRVPKTPPPKPSKVPTLASFSETYLEHSGAKNKPSSLDSKRQILRCHIEPTLGAIPLDRVDFAAIEDLKHALLAKLAQKTVNNVLATLRRMLVLAAKRGLIPAVPEVEWLRPPAPPFDFLGFEEGERLLAAAPEKWRSMFTLGMRTGLRHGELLGLRWEDVDLVAGRLLVRQAIVRNKVTTPKSGKHREVGLGADATAALKAQRHLRGPYVFCRDDGKPLTKGECIRPLSSTCRRAGLRHIGWHVLRHTFASHLAMRGVPIRVIQELLGHSTIQMTMRYAHLSPEVGREAVLLIDAGHRVPDGVGTGSTWRNRKG